MSRTKDFPLFLCSPEIHSLLNWKQEQGTGQASLAELADNNGLRSRKSRGISGWTLARGDCFLEGQGQSKARLEAGEIGDQNSERK